MGSVIHYYTALSADMIVPLQDTGTPPDHVSKSRYGEGKNLLTNLQLKHLPSDTYRHHNAATLKYARFS